MWGTLVKKRATAQLAYDGKDGGLLLGIEEDDSEKRSRSSEGSAEPNDVGADEVDFVVARIKRMVRQAGLEFALNVGSVIIYHFYGGDVCAWQSRGPKTASFRRLAAHPDVPLSAAALYRCVALFELCGRLNAPTRWTHLGASHLRLVLGLPSHVQENLLVTANAERWTVRVLQEAVLARKALGPERSRRRAQHHITRCLTSLRRSVLDYHDALSRFEEMSAREADQGLRLVEELRARLEVLQRELQARMPPQLETTTPVGRALTAGSS